MSAGDRVGATARVAPVARRIAFYLPALDNGGMEQVTLCLAEGFADLGHCVDLLLEHERGGYLARVPPPVGVVVLEKGEKWQAYVPLIRHWPRMGLRQLAGTLLPGSRYVPLRRLLSLVAYLRRAKPEVVVAAHGRIPLLAIWAARMAAVGTRVIVVEHSTLSRWFDVFKDEPAKLSRLSQRRALAGRLYPRADAIVAVSNGVADDLAQALAIDRGLITTIYNPVVSRTLQAKADAAVAHAWFVPGEPPVVLAVGRLVREKDFAALIDAFATLRSARPARLVILGEGPERAALEQRIRARGLSDDVALPGWVDNPYAYMRRSAVFVLCSMFEGLGVVLIEAMACGCPVVSTDCPSGPREILEDGRYGPLVPMNDTCALARAIQATLDEPISGDVLRARANDFSVEQGVAAYQRLVEHVLDVASSNDGPRGGVPG